jgi:3',5'-cyclic AMP phosphodiesterase CpdA
LRTLAHLSDLHFGRIDAAALGPLRARLKALAPDLVVVSGDLTQRARAEQFRQARAYLDTLPKPQLVVPGNHDVPLYNVFQRFFRPLEKFRRLVSDDPEPAFIDEEIAVLGVNTARSFVFKGGRVSEAQLARVRGRIDHLDQALTRILVTHHPFDLSGNGRGADVLLSGHLHASLAEPSRRAGRPAVMVQAGTATSNRTRGTPNSFNLLRVKPGRIEVDQYVLAGGEFVQGLTHVFDRRAEGWVRSQGRA